MKILSQIKSAAALAAILIVASVYGPAGAAEESATVPTNPGFKAGTGQINPGREDQARSQSDAVRDIPSPEEARRALLMPIPRQPSAGNTSNAPRPEMQTVGGPGENQNSKNAIGGVAGLTSAGTTPGSEGAKPGASAAANGAGSTATAEPPPSGPIGSFGETIPAKFSQRNDILDRVPIMALPQPLDDQQRKQIYEAVMADSSQPVSGADALRPASELSTEQALNGMRQLPESVRSMASLSKLQYLKAKNKVLLVEPSTRTVVDEITS